ncbi:hypothetical protein DL767_007436 [Monosporascus sp. MG133]|nr:hypothetical protein DL767_007436 [Monosporascus sp. MG133]
MGDSADIDILDPAINNPGNYHPAGTPTGSPMVDIGDACIESLTTAPTSADFSRCAIDGSIATDSTAESRRSPDESGGMPEPGSPSSPFSGRERNIYVPTLPNIQHYIPLIDDLLAAADKEKEALKELIEARFDVLIRNSEAENRDATPTPRPVLRTSRGRSDEHIKETVADNQIDISPKASQEIIDLTSDVSDHESEGRPPIKTPNFSRKKRKHDSQEPGSNAPSDISPKAPQEIIDLTSDVSDHESEGHPPIKTPSFS